MQPAINIPSNIADSLCRQLSSFQQALEARGGDQAYPTPQEVNIQGKMISNVIRIKKYNATDHVGIAMKKFISFLRKQDRQLAAEVAEKYKEFTWVDDEYQTAITEVPSPLPTATPEQPEPEESYLLDPPPITEQDFDQFKWCLHNINEAPGRTTYILNGGGI